MYKCKIFDTICNATQVRQTEASQIAAESDFMVVIGDRHSSNTGKLLIYAKDSVRTRFSLKPLPSLI